MWISSNVNGVVNSEQSIEDCHQHQSELIGLGTNFLLRPSRVNYFLCRGEISEIRRA